MQISMYTGYAWELVRTGEFASFTEALGHFVKKGVQYGSMIDASFLECPLHLYCDSMQEAGMKPDSLVSMLNIASFDAHEREKNLATVKGYIDQMEKLHIPILMPAPSVRRAQNAEELNVMRELLVEGFAHLVEYAKGSGIMVTLENQSSRLRADSTIEDLHYILKSVPGLGFVLDNGNFYCINEQAETAYEKLRAYMVHAHIKDWQEDPFGMYVDENKPRYNGAALGEGFLPLERFLQLLKRDEYKGNLVIEINSHSICEEQVTKSVEFLKTELK